MQLSKWRISKRCYFGATVEIDAQISKQVCEQNIRVRRGILSIINVTLLLGQRGKAFRGNYHKDWKEEDDNYILFINWKSEFDEKIIYYIPLAILNIPHLNHRMRLLHFVVIISGKGSFSLFQSIGHYARWSWRCWDSRAIECFHPIRKQGRSRSMRVLYRFIPLEKMDAQSIFNLLIPNIKEWWLDLSCMDGAAVMSGEKGGLQRLIKEVEDFALYVHCFVAIHIICSQKYFINT